MRKKGKWRENEEKRETEGKMRKKKKRRGK